MLTNIIHFALRNRLIVLCASLAVIVIGSMMASSLPIDVLPNLTRPRVVVITECPGMAPEEVEKLVTAQLESAVRGASDVIAVRSSSDIGLSVINVEFDWGTEIYQARQVVQERIATVEGRLPQGVQPHLGPISSLLGQIALVGMWSDSGQTDLIEIRTLADWVVQQRLLKIPGVSQVITMGGGRKQYQLLVDIQRLQRHDVTLAEIERALRQSNLNVNGGYINQDAQELLVRGVGRVNRIEQLGKTVVKINQQRPVLLEQVADIEVGVQPMRGDSSVNGHPAVVLTIQKQPRADTRKLTEQVELALQEIRGSLPDDVRMEVTYQQRDFINHGVTNVVNALRDGSILVVIVLFLFLLNFRTTLITLTAIPISIVVTAIVFYAMGMSINVMTLGGIAVAIGELVDDAIVGVENIFRRLKQNAARPHPRPVFPVVFEASVEVRKAIMISTVLVIVVFSPLFFLTGLEGQLFRPLGVAYIVAILASTVVSLMLTPVLAYYLLPRSQGVRRQRDALALRWLKAVARPVIRFSLNPLGFGVALAAVLVGVAISLGMVWMMGKDFLPEFNEGAAQVNLIAAPGTSLETSRQISAVADDQFSQLVRSDQQPSAPLVWFTSKTGRAEMDEHVMGVNVSEVVITLNPQSRLDRKQIIEVLHHAVEEIPGVQAEVEQPIAHLISHLLSGVTAQIAVKVYGDNLDVLRRKAEEIKQAIQDIPGIAPPTIEPQTLVPQLRIDLDPEQLAFYGLTAADVHGFVETAMNGRTVSQFYEGERQFDVVLKLAEQYRRDVTNLARIPIELPTGGRIPLAAVAKVYTSGGPNTINREDGRRRVVIRVNTMGRDLESAVSEIRRRIDSSVPLPQGYYVEMGGQFEAQRTAAMRMGLLSVVALLVVFLVLYATFPSASIVFQILFALPAAFVGGVLGLALTGQTMTVAAMVGFISLGGIAARNGLLLISTYLDLIPQQGYRAETVMHGSLERLAPVLMTALTTGIALLPLVFNGHLPGREILFPIATVILGGLISSTACEFLIRPGMFWFWSRRASERLEAKLRARQSEDRVALHLPAAGEIDRPQASDPPLVGPTA